MHVPKKEGFLVQQHYFKHFLVHFKPWLVQFLTYLTQKTLFLALVGEIFLGSKWRTLSFSPPFPLSVSTCSARGSQDLTICANLHCTTFTISSIGGNIVQYPQYTQQEYNIQNSRTHCTISTGGAIRPVGGGDRADIWDIGDAGNKTCQLHLSHQRRGAQCLRIGQ